MCLLTKNIKEVRNSVYFREQFYYRMTHVCLKSPVVFSISYKGIGAVWQGYLHRFECANFSVFTLRSLSQNIWTVNSHPFCNDKAATLGLYSFCCKACRGYPVCNDHPWIVYHTTSHRWLPIQTWGGDTSATCLLTTLLGTFKIPQERDIPRRLPWWLFSEHST